MTDLAVFCGRLIDPANDVDKGYVTILISGGVVTEIRDGYHRPEGYEFIDAQGLVVSPGFVDLHTHLREPGFEDKETIESGTRAAAAGGFTTVCCMPNTEPALDTPELVKWVLGRAKERARVRVYVIGAITEGRKGQKLADLEGMAAAGAVAFSDDGDAVMSPSLMIEALLAGKELGRPIVQHSEDVDLVRNGVMHDGRVSARLGLGGRPTQAEARIVDRDLVLAEETGGHLHVAHLSTIEALNHVVSARRRNTRVTCEVTPHHLTLTDNLVAGHDWLTGTRLEPLDPNTKVNPPLRPLRDVVGLGVALAEGQIDCIATDHAPHTAMDKSVTYTQAASGFSNIETAFGSVMSLVHSRWITLNEAIALMTYKPARVFGLDVGTLSVGSNADLTIFDPNERWAVVPDFFRSKGKNTPLAGSTLVGKVFCTIVGGEIGYRASGI